MGFANLFYLEQYGVQLLFQLHVSEGPTGTVYSVLTHTEVEGELVLNFFECDSKEDAYEQINGMQIKDAIRWYKTSVRAYDGLKAERSVNALIDDVLKKPE